MTVCGATVRGWAGCRGSSTGCTWWSGKRPGHTPDTLTSDITGVEDLVDLLRAIDDDLDPKDGVRAFNHLYLRVTELVNDRMTDGYFTNPRFVARLDIRFASLYLEALPAPVPTAAWAPVFELRHAPDRLPIQYALAGMNAHINHDLPLRWSRRAGTSGWLRRAPASSATTSGSTICSPASRRRCASRSSRAWPWRSIERTPPPWPTSSVRGASTGQGRGVDERQRPLAAGPARTAPDGLRGDALALGRPGRRGCC